MSDCVINDLYSGVCGLGTKGCTVNHSREDEQSKRIADLGRELREAARYFDGAIEVQYELRQVADEYQEVIEDLRAQLAEAQKTAEHKALVVLLKGRVESLEQQLAEVQKENERLRNLIKGMGTGFDDAAIDAARESDDLRKREVGE